jgi:NADPH:quinone reductase
MRAVAFTEFGGPDVLRVMEFPEPQANAGEVVVRVVAATVNPTDTLMRAGRQASLMTTLSPPYIAGMEFAGYVHTVGDDSTPLTVGERVMGAVNARRPQGGAHAQYVCVPGASLAPLDAAIDLIEAATVPMNGLTANMAVATLELPRGSTILVTGGAGAVGGYAIQLARQAGLTVIADAKESDVDTVRRLGADVVVPRGDEMEAAVRQCCPNGVDGLIDAALLGDRAGALLRDGGVAVTLRMANAIKDPRVRGRYVSALEQMTNTAALVRLAELVSNGSLTPRLAARLPMSEAAKAHRMVEQGGQRGRVVLMLRD